MASLRTILGLIRRRGYRESTGAFAIRPNDVDGADLFDAANRVLETEGQDTTILMEPGNFTVSTQLRTFADGQTIFGNGVSVELDDGADIDMVDIRHNDFGLRQMNLIGNRANNAITSCIKSDAGVDDLTLDDIQVAGAPEGFSLDEVVRSKMGNCGTAEQGSDLDTVLRMTNCEDISAQNLSCRGFNTEALVAENSDGIQALALDIIPEAGVGATNGVRASGIRASTIRGTVRADGEIQVGLLDEAFDVGGPDERFPTNNRFEFNMIGVEDIGFHLQDGEKESVDGKVDGGGTRTNQAFFVEDANGLANPQHTIDLDGSRIGRITDTQETGSNVGVGFNGHYSQVQNPSVVGLGGEGEINIRFGQATPNPTLSILSGTNVIMREEAQQDNTDNQGQINIDWSDKFAFEDKPIIVVELEQAGEWFVDSFNTDGNGRFIDADIQITDSTGAAVGNNIPATVKVLGV